MKLLADYLNKKRKEKLYSQIFLLKTDSAKFLQQSKSYVDAANNVRRLIKIKENVSDRGVYLSTYLSDLNQQIISFEERSAISYQQHLNAQETISLMQKEIDSIS